MMPEIPEARLRERLAGDIAETQRLTEGNGRPAARPGAVGMTMFDLPGSEDSTVTVLLGRDNAQSAPAQALVRIESQPDGRRYLGVVTAGPFAEPDSLRADSAVLVTAATRGVGYLPPFHGRVQVTLLGQELDDGTLVPHRLRPLPHSPAYRLSAEESARVLRATGDVRLGLAVGHDELPVCLPSNAKSVLPRHTAVLGTTGGGKSTTVAGLVQQAQAAGLAVVLLDVEGEYTALNEPAGDPHMRRALAQRGLAPGGLPEGSMTVYHLVGRDPANPAHPRLVPFSLQFARVSPYAAMEMLGLSDAQTDRFLYAYDRAKVLLRELGIFPRKDADAQERDRQEQLALRIDEFERGYPRLTLSLLLDVVGTCKSAVTKAPFVPHNACLKTPEGVQAMKKVLDHRDMPGNAASWGKLHSLLWRLWRLKVFDRHGQGARVLDYRELLCPGRVSIIDLSDAGMAELTNIAIADLLRGLQEAQESAYREHERSGGRGEAGPPARALVVIEEAHEFLSEERIARTPVLYEQVARLAKRGRKRWLGLVFVTQLPGHLPRQVLGLVNNYIIHKLTDPAVASLLRKTVSGVDEGLWARLAGLAPGQAIVSFGHMARPLLVAMDPAPGKLRLVE
jgi:DNA helicase HerA-like ATPase